MSILSVDVFSNVESNTIEVHIRDGENTIDSIYSNSLNDVLTLIQLLRPTCVNFLRNGGNYNPIVSCANPVSELNKNMPYEVTDAL